MTRKDVGANPAHLGIPVVCVSARLDGWRATATLPGCLDEPGGRGVGFAVQVTCNNRPVVGLENVQAVFSRRACKVKADGCFGERLAGRLDVNLAEDSPWIVLDKILEKCQGLKISEKVL